MGVLEESGRLARRRFVAVVIVSAFVIMIVGALSYANFIYTKNNAINRVVYTELPWLSQKIESQIVADLVAPLAVANDMAHDPWLQKWVLDGERTPAELTKKLSSAQASHGMLTAFLVSDKTAKYYNESGLLKVLDLKKDPHDVWFYSFKDYAKTKDYEVVTDTSQANKDTLTIFINYALRANDRNFLAAVGFGLTVKDFGKKIKEFKSGRSDIQLWLVDESGDVRVSENGSGIAICSDKSSKFSMKALFGVDNAKVIQENENNVVRIIHNGVAQYVIIRYIKDLNWYIVAKVDEDSVISGMNQEFLQNEAIFSAVMLMLAVIGVWFYNKSWMHKEHTMLRLTAIFESSSLGICIVNKKGRFIEANNALIQILGTEMAKIKMSYFESIVSPDKKELVAGYVKNIFEAKLETIGLPVELLRANGTNILVNMTLSGVVDYNGNVDFVYAVIEDITERKLLRDKQKKQEGLLIQQSKMAALGEMIDMVAHQWKQPLNALGISLQEAIYFGDSDDDTDGEIAKENAIKNIAIVENMSRTLDDFRGFFKPNKEKINFSIKDSVKKVHDIMRNTFNERGIKFCVEVDENLTCFGIANELQQVLLSLVTNAKDAFDKQQAEKRITVQASGIEKAILIIISDNAGGIPDEFLEKIFEPRFTLKDKVGTGVGLYMSRLIVEESFAGKIWAQNTDDGALFTISIPVAG